MIYIAVRRVQKLSLAFGKVRSSHNQPVELTDIHTQLRHSGALPLSALLKGFDISREALHDPNWARAYTNSNLKVIEEAAVVWKEQPDLAALRGRTKLVGGDFFKPETLPPAQDGDVYFLRAILHDCKRLQALLSWQKFFKSSTERAQLWTILSFFWHRTELRTYQSLTS